MSAPAWSDSFTVDEFHNWIERQVTTIAVPTVRIETCGYCHGTGYRDVGEHTERCLMCAGRGRVATENGEI